MLRTKLLVAVGSILPLGALALWSLPTFTLAGEPETAIAQDAKAPDPAKAGSVKGAIKFEGKAPEREKIDMAADSVCQGLHKDSPPLKEEIVVKDGMLANVFVYVKKIDGYKFDVPKEAVVLDQHGCQYVPHVFGIQAGQKLSIKNSDGTTHNIHAFPRKNAPFNNGQPAGAANLEKDFKTAEMQVPIKCDIHPWMSATTYVMKHPCFAVSAANGTFEIKGIPPGEYEIEAIHETLGTQTSKVTIGEKESKELNFSFKPKG